MKEKILELIVMLFLGALFMAVMIYFVKMGDCQNKAKYEGRYNDNTTFDCLLIKNLDIGSNLY